MYYRDTLRLTKSSQLESIDGKKNKTVLGKKKKQFEFSHCQMPVEFAEVTSVSQDVVVEPIKDWLEKIQWRCILLLVLIMYYMFPIFGIFFLNVIITSVIHTGWIVFFFCIINFGNMYLFLFLYKYILTIFDCILYVVCKS